MNNSFGGDVLNKDKLAEQFVSVFIEFKPILEEHLEFNNEFLPHIFFGECNDYIIESLQKEEREKLVKLFDFFEKMAVAGDEYVRELLSVTILERIGDDKDILSIAHKYMGKETRKDSDEIEKFWRRY